MIKYEFCFILLANINYFGILEVIKFEFALFCLLILTILIFGIWEGGARGGPKMRGQGGPFWSEIIGGVY